MLPFALLLWPTVGLAQDQVVWLSDITTAVNEGGAISFTVNRNAGLVGDDLNVTVNIAPTSPIAGFNILSGGDDTDGVDVTLTIPRGDASSIGSIATINNSIVNDDVRVELEIQVTAGVLVHGSGGTPGIAYAIVANHDDEYVLGVRLPSPRHISQTVTEGEEIEILFIRCVGSGGTIQSCDDVTGARAGALSPPVKVQKIFVEGEENFFGAARLFDEVREAVGTEILPFPAVFMLPGSFSKRFRITTENDSVDEANGVLEVRTIADSTDRNRYVRIAINDNDLTRISIDPVSQSVTEGSAAVFRITRSDTELFPETTINVRLEYHTKKFEGGNLPAIDHALTLASGATYVDLTVPTLDDGLNDGDGMISASLRSVSSYIVGTEATWIRIVDDDVPAVTFSVNKTSVTEGESFEWKLTRSGYTDDNLNLHAAWRFHAYYPDHLFDDYSSYSALVDRAYAGSISAGNAERILKDTGTGGDRGPDADLVGPQGGWTERAILPFPADTFEGIPKSSDLTFNPRYTIADSSFHRVNIYNRDPGVEIEAQQDSVAEGGNLGFTISRYGGPPNIIATFASRIRINVEQTGGYLQDSELGERTITIPAGATSASLQITSIDDDLKKDDGDVTVTILAGAATDETEDTYTFSTVFSDFANRYSHKSVVRILNDDEGGVIISPTELLVIEGESEVYTVVLGSRPTGNVTVTPSVKVRRRSGNPPIVLARKVDVSGPLTFTTGNWREEQQVTVSGIEDRNTLDDAEVIIHSVSGGGYGSETVDDVAVTVDDNDTPRVTLALSPDSIAEDGGVSTVTASLDYASGADVTVEVSARPESLAVAADYALSGNTTLTITAGQTTSTGSVTITAADNNLDTANKTVTVKGMSTVVGNALTNGIAGPSDVELTLEDDDTRGVTISKTDLDIDEGNTGTYTVVLTSEPTANVTVTPSRTSGDSDVTANGALTFTTTTWNQAQTVTVSAAHDSNAQDDSAVIGHSVSGGDYGSVTASSVDVTVNDDETASSGVTLSASPATLSESASATTITVTATLDGGTRDSATSVIVVAGSGTATEGTDFENLRGFTITIPANSASQTGTFDLTPIQDTVDEPDETVVVAGASLLTSGIVVTGTTVEITDDDAPPAVTLSLSNTSIRETDDLITTNVEEHKTTVTASLNHASSELTIVTVSVAPDSPATSSDYSISSNYVLTIAAGSTSSAGVVTITAVNNDVDAANKTVQVKGAATNALDVTDPVDKALTLEDDDTRGVTISKTDLDIDEGNTGTYTVVLDTKPTASVTVTPSRTSGDSDVTANGALTFTTTNWNQAQTVTVSAAQDSDAQDDSAVIGHSVGGGDYGSVTASSVDVTVDDDETASSGVTLTVNPDEVSESASATTITVTATLNGGTRASATPVAVTAGSGTATSGTDFAAVNGFTITIPANSASQTGTFNLDPTQDTVDEPNETVNVAGTTTASGFVVTGATVEITDDDAPPAVTLSLSNTLISEDGGIATVSASLNHASSESTTVTVSVAPDSPATSSDYSISSNKVLTIAAGSTSSTGTVAITGVDNDIDAANKTVQVKGAATNALDVTDPVDKALTLEDDDTRGVTVSKTDLDIDEGNTGTYAVVLTSEPTADVIVTPSRNSGDSDVTVSGALTFTTTNWNQAQTVTVSAAQDSDAQDDSAVIGHSVGGGDYGSVTASSVDVTVDDDETASSGVTLTVNPDEVSESASATTITVTATLNGGTRASATPVAVAVGSGTATSGTDFATVNGFTITIPANTASHTGAFSFDPTQDTVDEPDETAVVAGTTTVSGIAVTGTTVEITDDDASPTVTLSLTRNSIREADDSTTTSIEEHKTTVTASLNHASSESTTVTVSVAPDSPATSSDYSISSNKVLTIAAGSTSSAGVVTITAVNNDVDAANKTVQVKGAATNALDVTDPVDKALTLEDDDTRGVTVSKTDLDIDEGNTGTYTVMLDTKPTASVTVTPSRTSGDSDVTANGALTFTATNWNQAQTVTVSAAQDSDAQDDSAVIGHSVSGGDYGSVTASSVDVTVDDDETASSGVTLSVSPDTLSESANASAITVRATLNGGTRDSATPVAVTVGSGTATSGTDFAAVNGFTITIPANTASHTGAFSFDPTQDTVDEPDESAVVTGTTTVSGIAVTGTTVEITDDDASPTVTLSLTRNSIREADDSTTTSIEEHKTTVTASLNHASSESTTVTVSVAPDSPATSSDYSISSNKVLTIAAGSTSSAGVVTITAVNNDVDAANKTVQVKGAATNALDVTDPVDKALTLEDDDTRGVTVSKTDLDIDEGNIGTYTVMLDTKPTASVTVTPSRTSGDSDVTANGALTFTATNWNQAQTVTVSAAQDSDAQDDSAVIGHSVSGGDYGSVTASSVDVTVDDDETASSGVTLSVSPDTLSESANASAITVRATLNGGTRDSATPVAVTVGSGTATSGTDFAAVTGFAITIPANSASQTGTFNLDPTQDTVDEPNETVDVAGTTTVPGFSVTDAEIEITDDDSTPSVSLSLTNSKISEDGGIAAVRASLNHASSASTTVTVSVTPDSPATSSDYSLSTNKILTIAAGATDSTGTVTITGLNNDIDAADKTAQVKGVATNGLDVTDPADVTLTLEDDDIRGVTISKTALGIIESNNGTYTVVLDTRPTASVTVTPSRTSGDTDITVSGALTFTTTNWNQPQTVTVSAVQDSDAQDDSAVIGHSVSGGDYAGATAAPVDVTVDDDETASSGVTLSVNPDAVAEGAAATTVTVSATLNGGTRDSATPVAVTVGSGTATSGTDFAAVNVFTLTIPANIQSQTATFSLDPTQDAVDEPHETVAVTGTTTVSGFSVTGTTVEITDDDAPPAVTLSLSNTSISEDGGIATVSASLNHASSESTTVTVSVAPDSPATSSDYSISSNKVLTIAAGSTSSTGTVAITGVDNDIDAANKTVQVKGAATNALDVTDPVDKALTLEDDDTRGVTISKTDLDIDEGNTGIYTVVLDTKPTASVTVTPSRTSGDTDITVSGALTFTATNWNQAQTVTVSAAQDSDAQDDSAVIGHSVSGGDYAGVTTASVDVTVDDDETASSGVTLSVSPDTLSESASASTITVRATLNGGTRASATPVAVTVGSGTAASGTDFAAVTGFTITIPANSASQTGTFNLDPTQDTVDEPDETVDVAGTTTVSSFAVTGTTVEITDDDASPTVTLSLTRNSIRETDDSTTTNVEEHKTAVRASLSHASSVATTVTISVDPATPATTSDYSISSNKVLTFAAGSTSSTGEVTITAVNNAVDAANKTVAVKGSASNTVGINSPADVTLTLEDDDTRGVTISETDLGIDEGNTGTYTVVLTSEPTADVIVTPSRNSGDSDVTVSGALTFTTTTWNQAQTVTVSAAQDSDAQDDSAVIGHSVSGGDYGSVTASSVDVTVDDDETASSGVTLTVNPDEVSESASATTITVMATLNGGTRASATPVAVTAGSGTATAGTDFATVNGFTITIPANTASHTGAFSLDPTHDTVDEPDETVNVAGTTTASGFAVTGATVEITDDDAPPAVTLSLSNTSISEDGGIATVSASLNHASSESTTVTVSVAPDSPATSSDYSISSNKVLTIAAGSTSSTGTVAITGVDNDIDAANKTVQVKGAATNALDVTDPVDKALTLEDDDTRGVTVSKTDLDIDEGNTGTYAVVLDTKPTASVTVTPSRTSGDSDVTVSGALTFTATTWNQAQTVTVSAAQDSDAQDDSAVIGHSVGGGDYAGVTTASVDVTVDDDETASSGVKLSANPDEVSEGASATTITVTATLDGGTRDSATPVAVMVGSGTATSGTDFAAVNGFTITIPANTASHTGAFSLDPTHDTVDEPDETVNVAGTTTASGFAVTGATVEITDDDAPPAVTLSLSNTSISEDGGIATVSASLNHASSESTTVTVSVAPDSPATSSDYSISSNKVLTIAAGSTSSAGTVTITGVDNDIDAANKTVQVKGAASNALDVTDPVDKALTLEDDDTRGVTVSKTDLDIDEGNTGTYAVVLTSEPTADVIVTPSRNSGDTDVTVSGALTFTTTTWNQAQTVTVSAAQDSDAQDDSAVIGHSVSGGDYGSTAAGSVNIGVDDDETASSGVTLSVSLDTLSESASASTITVRATLNGGTRDSATPVAVTVGSGTATSGTDFAAVNGFTITIPANTASHTGAFSLDPTHDTVDEPDETVNVAGTTTASGFAVTGATVEITDDDAPPAVTLSLSNTSISEDGGIATVSASLNHASSESTTVTVSVAPDSPATSSDYSISSNKVLTIAAGSTSSTGTVAITGVDNDIDAANKTVQVKGAATNALDVTDPVDKALTLEDDDTRGVTVSKTDLDIDEGNTGTYAVVLDTKPTASVTVTPSRTSGDSDVTVSGALTFTATTWNQAQTVTVSAAQDSDAQDDSAVIGHSVGGGDYAGVTTASVDVTVDDDETASSGVTLTVNPDEVSESASATTITVTATLNGGTRASATPVAVTVGSGTAASGTDFAAVTGFTITIPANSASQTGTFNLDPTQDTVDEPDETVDVAGTTTVSSFAVTGTTVEITDDDASPTVTLSLTRNSIRETDDSTTTNVEEHKTAVRASLGHASSVATTVTISVDPATPATSADYSISSNKVLTFAAGSTSSTGEVTITAVNNAVDAANKTVAVEGSASNTVGINSPADVTLTLEDDDTRGVKISKTDLDIDEGNTGTYMVVLTSEPTADVTVTPPRTSGDSDVTVSGALTFTTTNWNQPQTVTVSAAHDSDAQDDSAVIGHSVGGGDYAGVTTASVDVTVDDDETASSGVTLSVSPDTLSESASATTITVTATLDGGTRDSATPVAVTVGSGTATSGTDFATVTGFTITIPANSASQTGTFNLDPTQDTVDEPDETVDVAGTTTVSSFAVTGTTVEITDDDASPTVTLSLTRNSIRETDDSTTTNVEEHKTAVRASLSHASSVATTVTISVDPATPATTSDYSISSNKVLTFAAGSTSSTGEVTITAVNNAVDAANKTVAVEGSASNTVGINSPADVTLTLEDDDTRGVTVSKTDLGIDEGNTGTYTVVLTSEPTANVTVTPSRTSGDTDVTVSGALTFTTANWNIEKTVTVSAAQDSDAQDDSAVVGHSVGGGDYAGVTTASVDVTVDDDETASSGITLSVNPDEVSEGAGETTITVVATLNGGTRDAATPVAVTVGSGTAISGTDFAAVTGFTIMIPENTLSHTGAFNLTPTQDTVDEPGEMVNISGATTAAGFTVTGAEIEITDDDSSPAVTLSLSRNSIREADDSATIDIEEHKTTVTASLSHASSVATTVMIWVDPDTPATSSDYSISSNKELTIAAGSTSSTGEVTITAVNNDVDDLDKTVTVKGNVRNDLGVTSPDNLSLTIADDDEAGVARAGGSSPTTLTLTVSPDTVSEGAGATKITVTATLDGGTRDAATPVAVIVGSGTAISGTDFATVTGFTITIPENTASHTGTFSLDPIQDTVDEPDETAQVNGTTTVSGIAVTGTTVEITDDDAPPAVTLSLSNTSISEDGGTATVSASLNRASSESTMVTVSVAPDSPATSSDYSISSNKVLTIAAGSTSSTGEVTITAVDNDVDALDKTVTVKGDVSNDLGITGPDDLSLTIVDDDEARAARNSQPPEAPTALTLTVSPDRVSEGASATSITVTATLDGGTRDEATPVTVTAESGTAVSGTDFADVAGITITIPANSASHTGTISLAPTQDNADEQDETVLIIGSAAGLTVTGATIRIIDDDESALPLVSISMSRAAIAEDGGSALVSARLSHALDEALSVEIATALQSPTTAADYRLSSNTTLTILAGSTVSAGAVEITAQDNDVDSPDKAITISGSVPGDAKVSGPASVTLMIEDDDERGVVVSKTELELEEGGSDTYAVVLTSQPTADVTVTPSRSAGDKDVSASGALTFTATNWNAAQIVTVNAAQDEDAIEDTATITHQVSGADYEGETAAPVAVTVSDDDEEEVETILTLSLDPASVPEGAGQAGSPVTVTATLNHAGNAQDLAVTVSITAGTATETTDFAAIAPKVISIAAGETQGAATFTIIPVDDRIDEDNETLTVVGSVSASDLVVEPAGGLTLLIEDNDARGVTVHPTHLYLREHESMPYTVVLDSQPTEPVIVNISAVAVTEITVSPPQLTFTADDWSTPQVVTVSRENGAGADVVLTHDIVGRGFDIVPVADVTVKLLHSTAEIAAVDQSLAATGRVLLNSVVGVFDGRRRSLENPHALDENGSLAKSVGAELYGLAQLASGASQYPNSTGSMFNAGSGSGFGPGIGANIGADAGSGLGSGAAPSLGAGFSRQNAAGMMSIPGPATTGAGPMGTAGVSQAGMPQAGMSVGSSNWERQLWGRSFIIPLGLFGKNEDESEGAAHWTLWGASDLQNIAGAPESGRYDGELRAVYFGADRQIGERWLAGITLSRAMGDVGYQFTDRMGSSEGTLGTRLTNLYPYLIGQLSEDLDVWAVGGIGQGNAEAESQRMNITESGDLGVRLAAAGFRLGMARYGAARLSMVGDAGYTALTVNDGGGVLEGLESTVQRVRLGIEGEVDLITMQPFWQLSARHDGGDGQTGNGLDFVAGVRYTAPRVNFEAQGRWLLLHSAAGYEEFSATASLTVSANDDSSGFILRLSPSWGQGATGFAGMGGAMELWRDQSQASAWNRTVNADPRLSFDSEFGYGFLTPRGVLTPMLSVSQNGTPGQIYSLGIGYLSLQDLVARDLSLQLTVGHDTSRPQDQVYGFRLVYQF